MNLPRLLLTRAATVAAFLLALATSPVHAIVDVSPADGIPDIWAMKYGAAALSPDADTDGDGQKNSAEAAAGTNPLQAGSVIKITSVTSDGTGVHLTFPTELGKRYQVQTATTLVSPTWVDLGTPLAPDNSGTLTATNNAPDATSLFYRIRVQDIDSDGDGVSDWEEIQAGFDPYNSHSGGLNGPDDLSAISTALNATNVVSITSSGVPIAEPPSAGVSTDIGTFVVTRKGNLNAITVNYTVSGGATPGSDYVALSGSVTLGMGVNSATINVTPLPDSVLESPEAVIVTISPSAAYTVGSPSVAAVLINDYATANGTGLTAKFWEEGSTVLSQTVLPTFSGTSINGGIFPGLNQTTASWGATNANGCGIL